MGAIGYLLGQLLGWGILILVIVLVVKSKKKKKEQQLANQLRQEQQLKEAQVQEKQFLLDLFAKEIQKTLEICESEEEFWDNLYDSYLKSYDIDPEQLPALRERCENVSPLLETYKEAVQNLMDVSQNNVIFFNTSEQEQGIESSLNYLEQEERFHKDTVKTLPALSEFFEVHKKLVVDIYLPLEKILDFHQITWQCADMEIDENASDAVKEHFQPKKDFAQKLRHTHYIKNIVEFVWSYTICETLPQYNTPAVRELFMQFVENDTELYDKWKKIWARKWLELDRKHGSFLVHYDGLFGFLKSVEEFHGSPKWFYPTSERGVSWVGFKLNLEEYTKEECLRILDLYDQGILKGSYKKYSDPKYKVL